MVPKDYAYLYYQIAMWYAHNDPGTPVPDWCELLWPITDEEVEELIARYEKDTGRSVMELPEAYESAGGHSLVAKIRDQLEDARGGEE